MIKNHRKNHWHINGVVIRRVGVGRGQNHHIKETTGLDMIHGHAIVDLVAGQGHDLPPKGL